jgi:hypothetical protein
MRFSTLSAILIPLLCAGCVSVSLATKAEKRATGVKYDSPASPFQSESRHDVDGAWKNPKTGNLISYLTDCQDENDPSLDSVLQTALGGLTDMKTEKKESPTIEGREGRRTVVSGKVDGIASKIDMLAFKRDECIFILSYVGVEKPFEKDHAAFDKFIEGFHAP